MPLFVALEVGGEWRRGRHFVAEYLEEFWVGGVEISEEVPEDEERFSSERLCLASDDFDVNFFILNDFLIFLDFKRRNVLHYWVEEEAQD